MKILQRIPGDESSYVMKMKMCALWMVMAGCACSWAGAPLQLLPDRQPQCVFAGPGQAVSVTFSNAGGDDFAADVRVRVLQTSSATAVEVGTVAWKRLQVLPGQAVVDSAPLDFPDVAAATGFIVEWLGDSNRVIGRTDVTVYPTNLLAELKSMLAGDALGLLDPTGQVKPMLQRNGIAFLDLGERTLENFSGKLAVIGPFESKLHVRPGLRQSIERMASKGTPILWIQPPSDAKDELKPSFYMVPVGKGAVVVVQPELTAGLSETPQSQLNFVRLCKLALNPVPWALPDINSQP
jgi:hypothetical protein